ncbi:MAG: hypothetical protein ACXQS2_02195 [Methermicoccaceae archaeon]
MMSDNVYVEDECVMRVLEIDGEHFDAKVCEEIGGEWNESFESCTLDGFKHLSLSLSDDVATVKLRDKILKLHDIEGVYGKNIDASLHLSSMAPWYSVSGDGSRRITIKRKEERLYGVEPVSLLSVEVLP